MSEANSSTKPSISRRPFGVTLGALTLGTLAAGACMQRPVADVQPETTSVAVTEIKGGAVDKIDLLFVIDNSASMADKQKVLGAAVPNLVTRLVNPRCVQDGVVKPRVDGECPKGSNAEFQPVQDIHVAVITSSLGAFGNTGVCDDKVDGRNQNGHPKKTTGGKDFLSWGSRVAANDAGEKVGDLAVPFETLVRSAGEAGCGYEATMEAWYRFLVDPEPPVGFTECGTNGCKSAGVDQGVLASRQAFLRPDSLVAIIQLADENDCSVRDTGFGAYAIAKGLSQALTPSSTCDTDPNSRCCVACEAGAPEGCGNVCGSGSKQADDHVNMRCYQTKRRFGYDFLWGTDRYVEGLTAMSVPRRSGGKAANPLLTDANNPGYTRDLGIVFLGAITGLPYQDIAVTDERGFRYLSAKELSAQGRWDLILGDPKASPPKPPTDPFMVETWEVRTGTRPQDGPAPVGLSPATPNNEINRGDREIAIVDKQGHNDLQFTCTFDLKAPFDKCSESGSAAEKLCKNGEQVAAKGYPGTRFLEVLKGFAAKLRDLTPEGKGENNAVVGSICPKSYATGSVADDDYGYNPAVNAIVDRLKDALSAACLARPLEEGIAGGLPCTVVEATSAEDGCDCSIAGRTTVEGAVKEAVFNDMRAKGRCGGGEGLASCDDAGFCLCGLQVLPKDSACATDPADDDTGMEPGWCYVDPANGYGTPDVLEKLKCSGGARQSIRIVGKDTPSKSASTFITCNLQEDGQ